MHIYIYAYIYIYIYIYIYSTVIAVQRDFRGSTPVYYRIYSIYNMFSLIFRELEKQRIKTSVHLCVWRC